MCLFWLSYVCVPMTQKSEHWIYLELFFFKDGFSLCLAGLELAIYTNFKLTDILLPLPPKFWN